MFTLIALRLAPAALTVALAGTVFYPVICAADPADPLDPKAQVSALVYQSSLARYLPYRDAKPTGWREANEHTVRGDIAHGRLACLRPRSAAVQPSPRSAAAVERDRQAHAARRWRSQVALGARS